MRILLALFLLPWGLLSPAHQGVKPVEIVDARITLERVIQAVARIENCPLNPGCLRRATGEYPRYASQQEGMRRLRRWFDRHKHLPLREALAIFNPANPDYADIVLDLAGE